MTRTKKFLALFASGEIRTADGLALATGCTKQQARGALDALVTCGLIVRVKKEGKVVHYRITEEGRLRAGLKPLWKPRVELPALPPNETVALALRTQPNSVFALGAM